MVAGIGVDFTDFCAEAKDPMYTLPLPEAVLGVNPALSQNASANTPERKAE